MLALLILPRLLYDHPSVVPIPVDIDAFALPSLLPSISALPPPMMLP